MSDFNNVLGKRVRTLLTVGTSPVPVRVGGSNLVAREGVYIYNPSTVTVYRGDSSVTTSGANQGVPIGRKEDAWLAISDEFTEYLVADSSTEVIIEEWGS